MRTLLASRRESDSRADKALFGPMSPWIRDRFWAAFLLNAVLTYADSPELQLWAPLAHVSINDPIFMIHELKIDTFKLLIAHRSLHCGNDFILLASVLDFVHNNQGRLSEYRPRPWINENRWPIWSRHRVPKKRVNGCYLTCHSLSQSRCLIHFLCSSHTLGTCDNC